MTSTGKQSWFARHCKPAPAWRFAPACPCDACFRKQTYQPPKAQASDWPYVHPTVNNNGFEERKSPKSAAEPADWPYIHGSENNNGFSQPSSETSSLSGADDAASTSSKRLL
jgi:hypothetical protein